MLPCVSCAHRYLYLLLRCICDYSFYEIYVSWLYFLLIMELSLLFFLFCIWCWHRTYRNQDCCADKKSCTEVFYKGQFYCLLFLSCLWYMKLPLLGLDLMLEIRWLELFHMLHVIFLLRLAQLTVCLWYYLVIPRE